MFEGGILKAGVPEELVKMKMVRRVWGQNFELRKKRSSFKRVTKSGQFTVISLSTVSSSSEQVYVSDQCTVISLKKSVSE
jgi:hypothetical protein